MRNSMFIVDSSITHYFNHTIWHFYNCSPFLNNECWRGESVCIRVYVGLLFCKENQNLNFMKEIENLSSEFLNKDLGIAVEMGI